MADSIIECRCAGTGFVYDKICVKHLKQAWDAAIYKGDKELAAAILWKHNHMTDLSQGRS